MSELATQLQDAVSAWLERTGTAPARLGAEALGDPSFVLRLLRGRIPRMDTADRMLDFIGEPGFGPTFRAEVEAFIEVTGSKHHVFGLDAAGDPSFVARLRRGTSPRLDKAQRVLAWMAVNCSAAERALIRAAVVEMTGTTTSANSDSTVRQDTDDGGITFMNDQLGDYVGTRTAAAFLGLSPRTLDRYRVTGEGPAFHKFGARILYARDDLQSWAAARRMTSTSDDRAAGRRTGVADMLAAVAVVGMALVFVAGPAFASTDATFQGPLDTVTGMVGGTGGQLAAALAVGAALVGSVMRFNTQQLLGAVGVGVVAGAGVGIVTGLVGTAIV